MSGSVEKLERTVPEQVEVLVELKPLVGACRQKIVEDEGPAPIGVGPVRVLDLALARDEGRVREVCETAGVIEMRVRKDHVLHVGRLVADALDLLVQRVLLAPFE